MANHIAALLTMIDGMTICTPLRLKPEAYADYYFHTVSVIFRELCSPLVAAASLVGILEIDGVH
jgi:hypothetical protein